MCFDTAITDEAGQITEPSTLIPSTLARRTILVGDQAQLPPIVDQKQTVPLKPHDARILKQIGLQPRSSYGTSLFERLMTRWHDTEHATLLRYQYRMNHQIAAIASDLFYAGQIETGGGPEVSDQHLGNLLVQFNIDPELIEAEDSRIFAPEYPVIFIDTRSWGSTDSRISNNGDQSSKYNPLEAKIIANCIASLVNTCADDATRRELLKNIGIIAGYRAST